MFRIQKSWSKGMKIIISGGGTGGHVFPAIAIADAIKVLRPEIEILFVGAKNKLEMIEVPKAGYTIIGLDIGGFQRSFTWKNVKLIFKLGRALMISRRIIKEFKPDAVIGVGGYASGPLLKMAAWNKIPIFIQEQNSYAGVTNKLMSAKASKIFVAFSGMENYFEKSKIMLSGNPVRSDFLNKVNIADAYEKFKLEPNKTTIGVFGGSLGARTLNEAIDAHYTEIAERKDVQIIWQVGKLYWNEFQTHPISKLPNVRMLDFIDRMDMAYAVCDLCVARAGAITLSELAVTQTIAILVPSPNVAEDHQRKNAEAMVREEAAWMILDSEAKTKLWNTIQNLMKDDNWKNKIKNNLSRIAKPLAAQTIAQEIVKCLNK